jgi:hypothetical protein
VIDMDDYLRTHLTLVAIVVIAIVVSASVAYAVVNFLNNNELIDVTSPVAKLWSERKWEVTSMIWISNGDNGGHWLYNYGYVWHYYVRLMDGYTQDISSGDYAKFNIGDSFTYQKWVPKDR